MNIWFQNDAFRAYMRLFRRLLLTALVIYLLFFAVPTLLSYVMPFFFAFLMAFLLNPLINFLQRKLKISRGILSLILVLTVVLLLVGLLGVLLFALVSEIISLSQNINYLLECVVHFVMNISVHISAISEHIPFDTYEVERLLSSSLENILLWIYAQGANIAEAAINVSIYGFAGISNFVISFIFFLMASYFTMAHFPRIKDGLHNMLGAWVYGGLRTFKNTVTSAVGGYLRVQLIMALIIFTVSLIAFLVVGQSYALLLSLLFFGLDFLPLIGVGGVLVPWGLVSIFTGNVWYGVFLLGMYAVIFMLHRIIEPKLMGREMGLHPLLALLSLYLGMALGGVLGLIFAPMIATIVVSFYKAGLFDGLARDFKAVLNLHGKKEPG